MRPWFEILLQDLGYARRQAGKNLSFTLVCMAVLSIGIGSATAVFAALYETLLKPPPYRDFARLVFIHNVFPNAQVRTPVSGPEFEFLSTQRKMFDETAAYIFSDFTMTGAGFPRHVDGVNASASLFSMLGIPPELGRTLNPGEDHTGAAEVVLMSDAMWRNAFGSDPHIIGRTVYLNGEPHRIIGVMPRSFAFPSPATELWVPLALGRKDLLPGASGRDWLQMMAHIAPGLSHRRVSSTLADLSRAYASLFPEYYSARTGWHFSITPLVKQQTQAVRGWLLLAFGVVLCILLIACSNVSALLLVRASVRHREWAIRTAVGASPARVVRQLLTETAVLVITGCGGGIMFALGIIRAVAIYAPVSLRHTNLEIWAYMFALALSGVSAVLAAAFPVCSYLRMLPQQSLPSAGSRFASSRSLRKRNILVAVQIGIAVSLIFTAAELSRSLARLLDVKVGFSPEHVWSAAIQLPQLGYGTAERRSEFFQNLVNGVSNLPGVESASAGLIPFSPDGNWVGELRFPGRPKRSVRPSSIFNLALPGYFRTLRIPLVRGRTFMPEDNANSVRVVVINQAFAKEYFGHEDPVGKLVANERASGQPATIIGVVGNIVNGKLAAPQRPEIYWPELQAGNSAMYLVVRQTKRMDIDREVRELLYRADPGVALFGAETMAARVRDSLKLRRFITQLLNGLALVGILLAGLGLYGALAYLTEVRRHELAIRMAVGASPAGAAMLVLRQGVTIALAGLSLGVALALLSARAVRSFLFGVSAVDPCVIAYTLAALLVLVMSSAWLPALRAARTDPLVALRED